MKKPPAHVMNFALSPEEKAHVIKMAKERKLTQAMFVRLLVLQDMKERQR